MKNNCLTNRNCIKNTPEHGHVKSNSTLLSGALLSNRDVISIQRNYSNPFDSMIFSGKATPLLPPIINKHRKTPSIPAMKKLNCISNDRPSSRSLNPCKSDFMLPKITRRFVCNSIKSKINIPDTFNNLLTAHTMKNIATPSFNAVIPEDKTVEPKLKVTCKTIKRVNAGYNDISNAKLHNNQCLNEISFGDICPGENSSTFIKQS